MKWKHLTSKGFKLPIVPISTLDKEGSSKKKGRYGVYNNKGQLPHSPAAAEAEAAAPAPPPFSGPATPSAINMLSSRIS